MHNTIKVMNVTNFIPQISNHVSNKFKFNKKVKWGKNMKTNDVINANVKENKVINANENAKEKQVTKKVTKKTPKEKTKVADEILNKVRNNTKGLLNTNLGTKKLSVYKEECFIGCNEKEKKSLRKKFRNVLLSIAKSLIEEKNKDNKKKLINAFNEFYKDTYAINDYSLQSVCNENLSNEKKQILEIALKECKK